MKKQHWFILVILSLSLNITLFWHLHNNPVPKYYACTVVHSEGWQVSHNIRDKELDPFVETVFAIFGRDAEVKCSPDEYRTGSNLTEHCERTVHQLKTRLGAYGNNDLSISGNITHR